MDDLRAMSVDQLYDELTEAHFRERAAWDLYLWLRAHVSSVNVQAAQLNRVAEHGMRWDAVFCELAMRDALAPLPVEGVSA